MMHTQIDLHDKEAVEDFLAIFRPNVVVHCAAERRPDVAEADPEGTKKVRSLDPAVSLTLTHPTVAQR